MKTSAGALNTVPICKTTSMVSAIKYLQQSGLQVISCTEKGASPIKSFDYKLPTAIVLGSEDVGVSRECMDVSDGLGVIPMAGTIGSLNVSVAGGMVLYEVVCQRY